MIRKILYASLLLLVVSRVSAQNFDKNSVTKLSSQEDYKNAEPNVLKAANFLFSTPAKPETSDRLDALSFIIKWMEGTDAYTFNLGDDAMKLTKGSNALFGMYLVGLTKVFLENPEVTFEDKELHDKTVLLLATYCQKKEHGLKPSKVLKKMIKAMKKG